MKRPRFFRTRMQPHQMWALKWLVAKEKMEPPCGIFADDMGLGKTATIIALILKSTMEVVNQNQGDSDVSEDESSEPTSTSQESSEPAHASTAIPDPHGGEAGATQNPKGGTLIVCPLSLIGHWENEIMKHVTEPHGQHLSVRTHRGKEKTDNPHRLAEQTTVVITTYDVVRREANEGPLFKVIWERLILDEAHEIRNPDTKGCNAVTSLEAKRRWCVTGTPLHNSLTDLYALYKFLKWEPFNNKEVWEVLFGVNDMQHPELWTALKNASMLRRMKSEFIYSSRLNRLPEKTIVYIEIDLDTNEGEAYDAVAGFSNSLIDSAETHQDVERKKKRLMYCILLMRQITNHPSLLKEPEIPDPELDLDEPVITYESNDDLDEDQRRRPLEIPDGWLGTKRDLQQYLNLNDQVYDATRPSTKVKKLMEKLAEVIKKGDKAVVVSQWTRMLDIIESFLPKKVSHKTLKGGMSINDRDTVVNSFNKSSSGPKVLLLSLKAGGVGLNLIGGNHLFLYDVHWNPQLEAQACDRIHRLGQRKHVYIYKFVVKGTIEEIISDRQKGKLKLAESVLDNPSVRELRKLKSLADSGDEIVKIIKGSARSRKRKATTDLIEI